MLLNNSLGPSWGIYRGIKAKIYSWIGAFMGDLSRIKDSNRIMYELMNNICESWEVCRRSCNEPYWLCDIVGNLKFVRWCIARASVTPAMLKFTYSSWLGVALQETYCLCSIIWTWRFVCLCFERASVGPESLELTCSSWLGVALQWNKLTV